METLSNGDRTNECRDFLQDIVDVMLKHNKSISHEDSQGGFLVDILNEHDLIWFKAAAEIVDKN